MLFKYPQLLWFLWLLLIPVLIHLLQLRRFKTTPFTNVRLLKKVQAKSQKSQNLKRWLLLLTRIALFTALILAFAQPFTASESAFKEQEIAVYLDNSFSMQARQGPSLLLEEATQGLVRSVPEGLTFSLFTNDSEYREVTMEEVRNSLLQIQYSSDQLTLEEIRLRGKSFFSGESNVEAKMVILSDFQESMGTLNIPEDEEPEIFYVPMRADELINVSIDSVYFDASTGNDNGLHILVSGNTDFGSVPVSLFNKGSLIAKSAVAFNPSGVSEIVFSLPPGEDIEGRVSLEDTGLSYDNDLFFNLSTKEKIRVLGIGTRDEFLQRLFGDETSEYRSVASIEQALSLLANQDLVILNELSSLPEVGVQPLRDYIDLGGSLLLIPSLEMNAGDFNRLITPYGLSIAKKISAPLDITDINYRHPLFTDVFKDEVKNFQYPSVREYFTLNGNSDKILGFANEAPFLAGREKLYVFTASLQPENTNFTTSPLVVPTLYAMAMRSRSLPSLYYLLGSDSSEDVPVQLEEDRILSLRKGNMEVIPRQQAVGRNTRLWFSGGPTEAGAYSLENAPIGRSFSFNFTRKESDLTYIDLEDMNDGVILASSIEDLFSTIENDRRVTGLWKWFVILAVLFLLAEIIIQKAMK
ncbi:N-terminal double-transmembrane domain-containing protein [Muriicola jejuensis]|uniref:Aerotolerance regulator N-terminal domain-containing protein n=1 Tax=Muriicola jejuensis TaxID=504488 RepID=A0A6P0UH67_9FLAO|nr:BatA domain-containing protein [Muriicola jejuensis]NER11179.1 hypothetical protein [Muriicola jejuensis]SMP24170.1 N-terminal double-transmembrane domain-containing protein [Muriicola jejuensis]